MARFRGAGWAMLLWAVLVIIFAGVALVDLPECAEITTNPAELDECERVLGPLMIIVFVTVWIVGALVLLATRSDGIVRGFLVRVMINTLALLATLALLSFIRLPHTNPDGSVERIPLLVVPDEVLFVGVLFALVNAIARPVLFALFGRLVLRTLGMAVFLLNAVLFWLVSQISALLGSPWVTPDPMILWLAIDSVVYTVIVSVLDAFLGLDRPRLDPARDNRVWRFIDRLPARRRNALIESIRLQEVYQMVSRYGLEIAVGGTVLAPVRRLGDRMMGRSTSGLETLSTPAKVRVMLQQLGPTYVKIGQMASSRADALPEEWRAELDKLQNTVPPFPWEVASQIVETELGSPPDVIFGSIEHEPLAAASLAQVHRATLKDGREVVVKVQRPDVQAKVRADLGVVQELARVAESRLAIARQLDATGLAREFADGVLEELDYRVEAYHARRLADVLAPIEGVSVPAVHPDLSTDRVLTMDFVPGIKATRADQMDPSIDREAVARTFVRALIKQIMVDGFFHADPHPGNVMLDPRTGVLTFLDLGLIGELRQEQRFDLVALLWALRMREPDALASVALRLCVSTGRLDEPAYRADVERLFYQYWIYGSASFSEMVNALFATLREHGLRMRSELTLAVKAITQAEELLRAIKPGMALVDAAAHEAEQLLRQELTPGRLAKLARSELSAVVGQAISAAGANRPDLGPIILEAITGGRLGGGRSEPGQVDLAPITERLERLGVRMERLVRILATVIGGAGLAIALALVFAAFVLDPSAELEGLALAIAVVTAAAILWLGWTVYRGRDAAAPDED